MSSSHISLVLPKDSVKYVLFQRTQYLLFRRSSFFQKLKVLLPTRVGYALESFFSYQHLPVALEALFTRRTVAQLFGDELSAEYEQMKNYLPITAVSIFDIGSGIGGIDLFLAKHYAPVWPTVHLLDRTEMPSKVYYHFKEKACYYNSLPDAKKFLIQNGVPGNNVVLHEVPAEAAVAFPKDLDLVVSLISWGFHYPVATYLSSVYDALRVGGILIIDIRKNTAGVDGTAEIRAKFGSENVRTVHETSGVIRLVARKAPSFNFV